MREKLHDIMEDENPRIDKNTRNEVWESNKVENAS